MAAREIVDELAAQRSKVVAVEVADPPEAWRAAGFTVDDDDCATVGEIVVLLRSPAPALMLLLGARRPPALLSLISALLRPRSP